MLDIARGRDPKVLLVIAAEVGGVVVPDPKSGRGGVYTLIEHQLSGSLKPQLPLELHRGHVGNGLEVVVEAG